MSCYSLRTAHSASHSTSTSAKSVSLFWVVTTGIEEGTSVRRTGEILSVPVGDGFLGRVVDRTWKSN